MQMRTAEGRGTFPGALHGCGTLLPADAELTEKEICPYCGAARKIEVPRATIAATGSA